MVQVHGSNRKAIKQNNKLNNTVFGTGEKSLKVNNELIGSLGNLHGGIVEKELLEHSAISASLANNNVLGRMAANLKDSGMQGFLDFDDEKSLGLRVPMEEFLEHSAISEIKKVSNNNHDKIIKGAVILSPSQIFKEYVAETLVEDYDYSKEQAMEAIEASSLNKFLEEDFEGVMHYDCDFWAEKIAKSDNKYK